MQSVTLRTITFPRKGLKLETIVGLIRISDLSIKLDKELLDIIKDLHQRRKNILKIGYDVNPDNIRVTLASNLVGITDEEVIDFISQFKIPHLI